MDKYEYKHLVEQIQSLIDQGDYAQAVIIADRIDWRRVRSVTTLGTISDLYKINGRFEDARDILLLAYDRKPESRQICYSLCELYIKTGDPVNAAEFYKEFEKLAPKDPGRYVLKYKLYNAYDVSLDEKIEVLEKLKEEEYQEKWMYELASLYHKRGLGSKCVEVCDELILWFGTGKYVNMAMELKMLHEPLTPTQQEKYDHRFDQNPAPVQRHARPRPAQPQQVPQRPQPVTQQTTPMEGVSGDTAIWDASQVAHETAENMGETRVFNVDEVRKQLQNPAHGDDLDIQVKTVDVSQYNTMNLQAELAEGLKEILGTEEQPATPQEPAQEEKGLDPITRAIVSPMLDADSGPLDMPVMEGLEEEFAQEDVAKEPVAEPAKEPEAKQVTINWSAGSGEPYLDENGYFHEANEAPAPKQESTPSKLETEALTAQPPEPIAKVLTQESDGQLRFVVPESKKLEKQITGQLSIADIRAEWERWKQESQAKQEEETRQQVLRQTGRMFTEFEEAMRDNILKQMEATVDPASFVTDDEPWEETITEPEETKAEEAKPAEPVAEPAAKEPEKTSEEKPVEEKPAEEPVEETPAEEEKAEEPAESAEEKTEEPSEEEAKAEDAADAEPEKTEKATKAPEEATEEVVEEKPAEEEKAAEEAAKEPSGLEMRWSFFEHKESDKAEESQIAVDFDDIELGDDWGVESDDFQTTGKTAEAETKEDENEEGYEEDLEENYEETAAEDEEEPAEENEEEPAEEKPVMSAFAAARMAANLSMDDSIGEDDFSWSDETFEEAEIETKEQGEEEAPSDGAISFDNLPKEEEHAEGADEDDDEPALPKARELTKEEEEMYDSLLQSDSDREQLARAIDSISMAAFTGNLVITGEPGMNTLELAKKVIYEVKQSDSNFSGKVAKIPGKAMNNKDVVKLLDDLKNGALIIEKVSDVEDKPIAELQKNLQRENFGIIVALLDTKKAINKFFKAHEGLRPMFNARVDMQPLSNDALANFAREYAREQEFSIDNLGMLALHTRIDELQTADHAVTTTDVKEIMDDAIKSASRKTIGHFFDIILGRRYDEEDMIVITEKDFE
ncbi:MAG: hypothetical protein II139_00550 [Lachnospiraceae bacterium]|nr:hypothetical protein [Lachnospiraceae bacterium]